MPRVTRAAARADHDLADEIEKVAEIAIADDAASVPLPASPTKNPDRKPLGGTDGNASAPAQQEQHAPTPDCQPQDASAERITINIGDEENATLTGIIKDVSKSGNKSTRKGKGAATNTLRGQFNEHLGEWTQSMKGKPISPIKLDDKLGSSSPGSAKKSKRNKKKKSTQEGKGAEQQAPEIFEDERQATRSPASETAVELLKENSTPGRFLQGANPLLSSLLQASSQRTSLTSCRQ